jgi:hypothetical protein
MALESVSDAFLPALSEAQSEVLFRPINKGQKASDRSAINACIFSVRALSLIAFVAGG